MSETLCLRRRTNLAEAIYYVVLLVACLVVFGALVGMDFAGLANDVLSLISEGFQGLLSAVPSS